MVGLLLLIEQTGVVPAGGETIHYEGTEFWCPVARFYGAWFPHTHPYRENRF